MVLPRSPRRLLSSSLALLPLLLWLSTASAQQVTVRGFVTDGANGEPLRGASVVLQDAAGVAGEDLSDEDGYYEISGIRAGRHLLSIRYVGYTLYADTLVLGSEPFVTRTVALQPATEVLEEIVVASESDVAESRAGLQTIEAADLERIPTPGADGDLANYLQALPGTVAVGDRGGQLFIRGGSPTQNLVLVDGLLIYQPFHVIGFFSAFPQDLVSNADVYAGGFGARYSGRISSVIDVTTRTGDKQRFGAAVSASPFLLGARLEGPLRKGSVSILGSLRRSVIERVAPAWLGEDLPFRFGDWFVKVHSAREDNSRCSLLAMHTYDRGRIEADEGRGSDAFRWTNVVTGGRCLFVPSASPVVFELNSGVSYVKNEAGSADTPERSSEALQVSTELHLSHFMGRTQLHWGVFARANWVGYVLAKLFENVDRVDDLVIGTGLYLDAEVPVGETLRLMPGLALPFYPYAAPPSLEPRLRLAWRPAGPDGAHAVNAAVGLYRQSFAGISDERDIGTVFVAWVPPSEQAQAWAVHSLLGWQGRLAPWLRAGLEGYAKRLYDLPVPIWSSVASFTTTIEQANGTSVGADAFVEVQRPSFYAYLGYSLARTEYRARQDQFETWFGEPVQRYPPPHDRRHQVNAVFSARRGKLQANVRWQFGSGLPFTQALGFDELIPLQEYVDVRETLGIRRLLFERPYGARLPTYHRLDVSAERPFTLPGSTLTVEIGAINAYDRNNLFYFDLFTARRVDQLPLLPYLSLKLETK